MAKEKLTARNAVTTADSDSYIHVVKDGVSYKIKKSDFQKELSSGYRGKLAIADTPTADGYYMATETGTYTNAGSLVTDLSLGVNYINVSSTQTVFGLSVVTQSVSPVGAIERVNDEAVSGETTFAETEPLKQLSVIEYDSVTLVQDSYISRTTGEPVANAAFYRTEPIEIALIDDYFIAVDVGATGSSVFPVSYYNSATLITANWLGGEVDTATEQKEKYVLSVPSGATHFVLSSADAYSIAVYYNETLIDTKADYDAKIEAQYDKLSLREFLTIVPNSYIDRTTGEPVSNASFDRTTAIEIATLDTTYIAVDVGASGGSVYPVSYYNSSTLITANWLGGEVATASEQKTDYVLTIPSGATHFVLSSQDIYYMNVYTIRTLQEVEDAIPNTSLIKTSQIFSSLVDNPFGSEATFLQKRASLLSLDTDIAPLILIIGQSNADGRVAYADAPTFLTATGKMDDFMMWNRVGDRFQSYESGENVGADDNDDTDFAFDIHFANEWLTANSGDKLYAIKHTIGSSPIYEGGSETAVWQPKEELIVSGETKLAITLVDKVKNAIDYANENNIKLVPIAILFHQGENDGLTSAGSTAYEQNLKNLISWIRGVFIAPSLPFINGTIVSTSVTYASTINTAYTTLGALDDYMATVDMSAHETTIDGTHYDYVATEYLGEQMYQEFINFNPTY